MTNNMSSDGEKKKKTSFTSNYNFLGKKKYHLIKGHKTDT